MAATQINFNNVEELKESDIDAITKIVGHGCREKTKQRIRSILTYGRFTIKKYGIFERLIRFESPSGSRWEYVAGQSYPDEIRTLRECIIKG